MCLYITYWRMLDSPKSRKEAEILSKNVMAYFTCRQEHENDLFTIPNHRTLSVESTFGWVGFKGTDTMRSSRRANIFLSAEKLLQKLPAPGLLSYLSDIVTLFTHFGQSDVSSEHKTLVQS